MLFRQPLGPQCPYPFVWCLRLCVRNLGNLRSQVTISALPKCGIILTLCSLPGLSGPANMYQAENTEITMKTISFILYLLHHNVSYANIQQSLLSLYKDLLKSICFSFTIEVQTKINPLPPKKKGLIDKNLREIKYITRKLQLICLKYQTIAKVAQKTQNHNKLHL